MIGVFQRRLLGSGFDAFDALVSSCAGPAHALRTTGFPSTAGGAAAAAAVVGIATSFRQPAAAAYDLWRPAGGSATGAAHVRISDKAGPAVFLHANVQPGPVM